jgi:hypothetical protein
VQAIAGAIAPLERDRRPAAARPHRLRTRSSGSCPDVVPGGVGGPAAARPHDRSTPATIDQYEQLGQQLQGQYLAFDQSALLIWPHVVALVAMTALCFAAAYIWFMRQEVRA